MDDSKKPVNPAVFPGEPPGDNYKGGMTMRDYFAAKAPFPPPFEKASRLVRRLTHDGKGGGVVDNVRIFEQDSDWYARWAFQFADAMLEAREAKS